MKKALFLNLPFAEQITRRYMCSYVSPESLFPPLELISLAAIAREWKQKEVKLIDAIADKANHQKVLEQIAAFGPDVMVTITGLESIEEDCSEIAKIKVIFPDIKLIVFGHYPTQFPQEVLLKSNADFIILGEPEVIYSALQDALDGKIDTTEVKGIVYKNDEGILIQGEDKRIPDPNILPRPAYDLLPKMAYYEPMLPRPFSMIQTARGCPYQCTYCVKSFGSKLTIQSPERVVEEIEYLVAIHGIKSLRFIDDTFTIQRQRVIEICKLLVERNIHIQWACLSRTDNLTDEMLGWMKRSGCKRIYFGLESGSQRILDLYKKKVDVEEAVESLLLCRKHGIETSGFFMSGYPEENESDFEQTVDFAIRSKLTFASFNPLTPYPGTAIFTELKDQLDFSVFPYKNEFKDKSLATDFTRRKKAFYKRFYMRPSYFASNYKNLFTNIGELLTYGWSMLKYLFMGGKFALSGLKGPQDK
ncbi:MAG: radical SAM protein [Chitinophagales bacterium]